MAYATDIFEVVTLACTAALAYPLQGFAELQTKNFYPCQIVDRHSSSRANFAQEQGKP